MIRLRIALLLGRVADWLHPVSEENALIDSSKLADVPPEVADKALRAAREAFDQVISGYVSLRDGPYT